MPDDKRHQQFQQNLPDTPYGNTATPQMGERGGAEQKRGQDNTSQVGGGSRTHGTGHIALSD
jgi:hypothetical protein